MKLYMSVRDKFLLSFIAAVAWMFFSIYVAEVWRLELVGIMGAFAANAVVWGIAIIPGFMNAFLIMSLLLDHRPSRKLVPLKQYPPITVLVACYNEEKSILSTLESIDRQDYPRLFRVIAINDGSTDNTLAILNEAAKNKYHWLTVHDMGKNVGKANALNSALKLVNTKLTVTIDGDSYPSKDALTNLIARYMSDPDNTKACAGAILVRNSRVNMVTKIQEWDYFHGIAAIKRLQSLYQGTLVAQGAFSVYDTNVLRELGGWPDCVGEDIVLTWNILKQGYRVGYAENACLFTNAPETWSQFIKQRQRWSRGLIEAFKLHWPMLFKFRMTTLFIWWNLLFPYLDFAYTLGFIPGIILALFGYYWIAGPMTLIVLPLAMIVNFVMFNIQREMFNAQGLRVRRNVFGFMMYAFLYSIILQPACSVGYIKEFFNLRKTWGTK